ncbi:uncharacterized protein KGF55_001815 [Candida pseudojiufengensis]|uniref:uncharacterized protein n=1 Tax=Candida pseudojiufengensis TaxID=497109 RepID=UPI0022243187|nr:uncharacterized protein KGF55_001815 [Candida pseudojiufengensis]KAI5964745.1 hypothetical protein KGF55_001815 [Candida pseudojiufengensis]
MGLLDNFKAFVHSITTDDHYASYDSPYKTKNNDELNDNQSNNPYGNESSLNLNTDLNASTHSLNNNSTTSFYRPGMKSSQSKINIITNQQDVPLQNFDSNGLPPLPSIDSLWDRIETWIEEEYPELEDNLNDGVTTADLNEFLQDLKCGSNKLPNEFRQFYKRHDGQLRGGKPTGLIMGLVLLDLESIIEENILWNKVAERIEKQYYMMQHQQQQRNSSDLDSKEGNSSSSHTHKSQHKNNSFITNQRSIPPNSIQPYYYHKSWIILLKDNIGNQIAMDLSPGPNGKWGQIILFGRDFDTKLVISNSLQEFIFEFVTDLEQGKYMIDSSEFQEQLGYLSHDRDGDYIIGDEDENQGELNFFDKDGKEFGLGNLKGRINYIEILKRRALKKYGLNDNFQTIYQSPKFNNNSNNIKKQQQQQISSSNLNSTRNSPYQSKNNSSINLSNSSLNNNNHNKKVNGSSPLINVDNNSNFSIPKETIINKNNKEKSESKEKTQPEEKIEHTEKTEPKSVIVVNEEEKKTSGSDDKDKGLNELTEDLEDMKVDEPELKNETKDKVIEEEDKAKETNIKLDDEEEVEEKQQEEEEEEEEETGLEDEQNNKEEDSTSDTKPLSKSQKKNQKKKAKKQQQQQQQS